MVNLATAPLAIVLGYRVGGLDGACAGAFIAWLIAWALSAMVARGVVGKVDGYEKLSLRAVNELQVISQNLHRGFTALNGYAVGEDALWFDIRRALKHNLSITPKHLEDARECVTWRFKQDGYLPVGDADLLNIYGQWLASGSVNAAAAEARPT